MTFRRELYGQALLLGWLCMDISADRYLQTTSDPRALAFSTVTAYYHRTVGVESLLPIFVFGAIFFLIASHAFRFVLERSAKDLICSIIGGAVFYVFVERLEPHLHEALGDKEHAIEYLHHAHNERLVAVAFVLIMVVITLSHAPKFIPHRPELFLLAIVVALTTTDCMFDVPAQLWASDVYNVTAAVANNTLHLGGMIHGVIAPAITAILGVIALYRVVTRAGTVGDGLVLFIFVLAAPLFILVVEPREEALAESRKFANSNVLLGGVEKEHLFYIAVGHVTLLFAALCASVVSGLAVLRGVPKVKEA